MRCPRHCIGFVQVSIKNLGYNPASLGIQSLTVGSCFSVIWSSLSLSRSLRYCLDNCRGSLVISPYRHALTRMPYNYSCNDFTTTSQQFHNNFTTLIPLYPPSILYKRTIIPVARDTERHGAALPVLGPRHLQEWQPLQI